MDGQWVPPESDKVNSVWNPPSQDKVKFTKPVDPRQMTPEEFSSNMDLTPPSGPPGQNPKKYVAPIMVDKTYLLVANTPDDVVSALGGDPKSMPDYYKKRLFTYVQGERSNSKSSTYLGAAGSGMSKGFWDPVLGVGQNHAHALATLIPSKSTEALKNFADLTLRARDFFYKSHTRDYPITSTVGEAIGQVPLMLAAPEERLATLPALLKSAAFGAGLGAVQPSTGENFGQDKLTQMGVGGIGMPVGQFIGEQLFSPGLSKLNAARKGEAGLPVEAGRIQAIANREGIPTTAADLMRDPTSNVVTLANRQAEAPLFGTSGVHSGPKGQTVTGNNAVEDFTNQMTKKLGSTPFSAEHELRAAANGNNKPQFIVNLFDSAGNDPAKIAQAETQAQLWMRQQASNKKYELAKSLAPVGENPTEALTLGVKAQELLDAELQKGVNSNPDLVKYLKGMVKDLNPEAGATPLLRSQQIAKQGAVPQSIDPRLVEQVTNAVKTAGGGDAEVASALANLGFKGGMTAPNVASAVPVGVPTDYTALEKYVKGISEKSMDFLRPGGMATDASRVLGELHATGRDVLDQIAQKSGNPRFISATKEANENFKKNIAKPYFDNPEVAALMSENTPDVKSAMWKSMTPQQIEVIAGAMGEKGHHSISVQTLQDALEAAINTTKPIGYQFDPKTFSSFIQDRGAKVGHTFKGEDLQRLSELTDLFNNLQRAGKLPKTPLGITSGLMTEITTPMALLNNKWGKSLLASPGSTPIGSTQMDSLVRLLINQGVPAATIEKLTRTQSGHNPAYDKTTQVPLNAQE